MFICVDLGYSRSTMHPNELIIVSGLWNVSWSPHALLFHFSKQGNNQGRAPSRRGPLHSIKKPAIRGGGGGGGVGGGKKN